MSTEKQIFGDNFESGGGPMNTAMDHATAIQTNYPPVTDSGSSDKLLKLLATVQQELAALPLDENVKDEVLHEVRGAEIQAKKPEPRNAKIAAKLKDAAAVLEDSAKTVKGAITIGNLLGQAITWCGENWTLWT